MKFGTLCGRLRTNAEGEAANADADKEVTATPGRCDAVLTQCRKDRPTVGSMSSVRILILPAARRCRVATTADLAIVGWWNAAR
uniref:Uncharacterized protein n=1 Tax=Thermomicrobium roseum TaxID=500 RepID=A0A7C5RT70_THERO